MLNRRQELALNLVLHQLDDGSVPFQIQLYAVRSNELNLARDLYSASDIKHDFSGYCVKTTLICNFASDHVFGPIKMSDIGNLHRKQDIL